ncbi:hypothetical protein JL720_3964 [Aureococcus anophagefferens]|nr:hypothetical protein JL720_3964 [Aureococcus anophagefferens]
MSGVAEVLAQEANRRAEEDFADREQRKRKNYEYQLQQKHAAKAKAAQARGERHIEMRISGGVQRVDEDAWKEFYDHAAVKPIMETLTRLVREKLFKMRDDTTAQIERMCGAQMRRGPGGTQHSAGMAQPEGMFEEIFEKNMMAHVEPYQGRQGVLQAEIDAMRARETHAAVDDELKACLAHYAAEYHEGEEDYFDDDWGEDEELKEAHHQTMVESFHHCLLDEMLQIFSRPNEAGEERRRKKAPPKPKERKLDDETRRRVDAMIHHHAPSIRKLLDDYFGILYKSTRQQFLRQKNNGDPFASTKDPSKARRVRNMLFRKTLDPTRFFDSRWGAIDDEAAERLITAAAAKPEYERLRDDLVVAVLDCDKKGEPDAKMVLRLLFHLASHDRSIIEMSWFEDQSGHPWPRPPGEAQAAARLDVATRTMREVALRVARELGYAEAGDGDKLCDKFKFGEAIAPADDAPAPPAAPTTQDLKLKDAIERSEFSTPVSDEPPSVWASDDTAPARAPAKARAAAGEAAPAPPGGVSQAATDAHHKSLSVPRRVDPAAPASFAVLRARLAAAARGEAAAAAAAQGGEEEEARAEARGPEPPAPVPVPVRVDAGPRPPRPPPCAEAVPAVTTYAWDQSGKFVRVYVDLDGVDDVTVVSASFTSAGCAVRVADANNAERAFELKFSRLFRVDPSLCRVVVRTGAASSSSSGKATRPSSGARSSRTAPRTTSRSSRTSTTPADPQGGMDEQNARLADVRRKRNAALGDAAAAAGAELTELVRSKAPLAAARQCLERGARWRDSRYRGRNEYTLLHLAADERRADVARLLLELVAADVDARDMRGPVPNSTTGLGGPDQT